MKPGSLALIVTVVIVALAAFVGSQPSQAQGEASHRLHRLVGAWSVDTTVEIQQATFPTLMTFTSDGIVLADEPPNPSETTGHGNWVATGPRSAAFTFRVLVGSAPPSSLLSVSYKIVGKLEFDARADKWSGPFKIHIFDAAGIEIFVDSGTMTGTRIAVETLD